MSNDDIIRKTAIEFINCYWNVPYYTDTILVECIGNHIRKPCLTTDEYVAMLNADIKECCFVLSEIAINDHETFMYFVNRIRDEFVHIDGVDKEGCYDYRTIVTIAYNEEGADGRLYRRTKYFVIACDRYFEAQEIEVRTTEWRAK